jgi:hypothetical protein
MRARDRGVDTLGRTATLHTGVWDKRVGHGKQQQQHFSITVCTCFESDVALTFHEGKTDMDVLRGKAHRAMWHDASRGGLDSPAVVRLLTCSRGDVHWSSAVAEPAAYAHAVLRCTRAHLDRVVLSANTMLMSARDCFNQTVLLVLMLKENDCF